MVDVNMDRRQVRTDNGFSDLGTVFGEAGFRRAMQRLRPGRDRDLRGRWTKNLPRPIFDNRSVVLRGEPGKPAGQVNSRSDSGGPVGLLIGGGAPVFRPASRRTAPRNSPVPAAS